MTARWLLVFSAGLALMMGCASPPVLARGSSDVAKVIEDVGETLAANYVFAGETPAIMAQLQQRHSRGDYDRLGSADEIAQALSADLVEITQDAHFSIRYSPDSGTAPAFDLDEAEAAARSNFGFRRVAVLPGNIGYIRIDHFANPQLALGTATSAMQFVENADALIFDLRDNQGGYNELGQIISSYLFDGEKDVLLYDFTYVEDGRQIERGHWVAGAVAGNRRPDIPVYVLVSAQTFSAGEWFAQSLSELGRAIIVGERTAGAAHPVGLKRVNADLVMQVPVGVIRGPVTRGDFEGRGVDPQVAVPAHDALDKAQLLALETVDARNGSQRSAWFAPWLTAPPLTDPQVQADMRAIVGAYEGRVVAREGATLVYRWRERNALTLIPLGDGLFGVEGTYDYRFRLVRSDSGVAALVREFEDGTQVTYDRKD